MNFEIELPLLGYLFALLQTFRALRKLKFLLNGKAIYTNLSPGTGTRLG